MRGSHQSPRILIAEDERTSRVLLEAVLRGWGYEVVSTSNGKDAWDVLRADDAPGIAIIDRLMPGIDGVEICRRVRQLQRQPPPYVILLTVLGRKEDVVSGLRAGADDYVTKPFNNAELHARIQVGFRVQELEVSLARRVDELEEALSHVKVLQGTLPICMHCHRIKGDQESWERIEKYLQEHSDAQLSHGLCPECRKIHYGEVTVKREAQVCCGGSDDWEPPESDDGCRCGFPGESRPPSDE